MLKEKKGDHVIHKYFHLSLIDSLAKVCFVISHHVSRRIFRDQDLQTCHPSCDLHYMAQVAAVPLIINVLRLGRAGAN